MKTGDIFELAEVVRNLALRDGEKGLSTGEKQMYVKAKKILASELMYAKSFTEDEAIEWLEGVLTGSIKEPKTPAPVAKKPAAKATTVAKPAAKPAAKSAPRKPAAPARKTAASKTKTTVAKKTAPKPKPAPKRKTRAAA
jgi:hypothetical protein